MATTSSTLVAGKVGSQGGNGGNGRFGLKAKLVSGLAIIGCAAALAFGGAQRGDTAQSQPQAAQAAASMVDWEQVERAQVAPGQPTAVLDWEQHERAQVAPFQVVTVLDWEQAERTQVAPGLPAAAPSAPTQFGPQEYLLGEEPGSGGGAPNPTFGPQP